MYRPTDLSTDMKKVLSIISLKINLQMFLLCYVLLNFFVCQDNFKRLYKKLNKEYLCIQLNFFIQQNIIRLKRCFYI